MVRKNILVFALTLFVTIFISGCLITRSESDCTKLENEAWYDSWKVGEVSMCWQEVAISKALKSDSDGAITACENAGTPSSGLIQYAPSFAESNSNSCYSDIAAILHNETICDRIETQLIQGDIGPLSELWGSAKNKCKERAKQKGEKLTLCGSTAAFILVPLLILLSFYRKKQPG